MAEPKAMPKLRIFKILLKTISHDPLKTNIFFYKSMFKLFDGVYLSSASDAELTTWCREGVPFTEAELPVLDALAAAREYFLKGLSSDAHEDRVDYFGRGEHALSVAHCRAGDFTHLSDKIREEFD